MAGGYYGDPSGTTPASGPGLSGSSAEGSPGGSSLTPYHYAMATKLRRPGYTMAALGGTPTVNSPGVGGQVYAKQANATARKVDSDALALHNHLIGSQGSSGPMAAPNPYEHATIASFNARHPAVTPGSRIGVQMAQSPGRPGVQAPAARMATAGDSDMAGISQQGQLKPSSDWMNASEFSDSPKAPAPPPVAFQPAPIGKPGQYAPSLPQETTAASGSTVPQFAGRNQSPAQLSAILASQYGGMSGAPMRGRPGVQGPMMAGRVGVQMPGGPQHSGIPDPVNGGYYSVAAAEAGRHGDRDGRGHEYAQEVARGEKAASQQGTLMAQGAADHELGVQMKKAQIAGQLAQNASSPEDDAYYGLVKAGKTPAEATAIIGSRRPVTASNGAVPLPSGPATPEALALSHPEVAGMMAFDPDGSPKAEPSALLNMAKNSGIKLGDQNDPHAMALQKHLKMGYGDKLPGMMSTPEESLRTLPGLPEWVRAAFAGGTGGIFGKDGHGYFTEDMKGKQSLADQLSEAMGQPKAAPYRPTPNTDLRPWSGASGLYNRAVYGKP